MSLGLLDGPFGGIDPGGSDRQLLEPLGQGGTRLSAGRQLRLQFGAQRQPVASLGEGEFQSGLLLRLGSEPLRLTARIGGDGQPLFEAFGGGLQAGQAGNYLAQFAGGNVALPSRGFQFPRRRIEFQVAVVPVAGLRRLGTRRVCLLPAALRLLLSLLGQSAGQVGFREAPPRRLQPGLCRVQALAMARGFGQLPLKGDGLPLPLPQARLQLQQLASHSLSGRNTVRQRRQATAGGGETIAPESQRARQALVGDVELLEGK